ncbi:hypothetical protein O9992_00510 [Vibrio lentus]|nr:hypothetical protein [Vibrio lentus]
MFAVASALLALLVRRSLGDINSVNRLNEQWVGQVQVFKSLRWR